MAAIRSRLPSSHDILLAFAAIVFPIHFQAFIVWMLSVPSLIMQYTLWDTLGVISYIHVFVLFESIAVLIFLLSLAVLLPVKYYRSQFAALSSMFVFITVPFVLVATYFLRTRQIDLRLIEVLLFYIILIGIFYWLIQRYQRVRKIFYNLASLLTVLSLLYVSLDVIAIILLILRRAGI